MSRPGKKIAIRAGVFTFSLKLEKWSSHDHVSDFSRTGKKCTEIIKAREGRAKVLFLCIKYAKFVAFSLLSRRSSFKTAYCQLKGVNFNFRTLLFQATLCHVSHIAQKKPRVIT